MDLTITLAVQDGVIARRQALALGETPVSIARRLRRREWVSVHPGVYVDHTGPLTWQQRAWAAVLSAGPDAALCLDSVMRAHSGAGRTDTAEDVVHVAVARKRSPVEPPGVRIHRMARKRLDERTRIPQRAWLRSVLSDVADGTCSVLEHGYLDLVERPHGLPVGERQAVRRGSTGRVYCDVDYAGLRFRVELDGKLFHTSTKDRDRDLDRDLDAAVAGTALTVRLGFGQVHDRPCQTAAKVALVIRRRGWTGSFVACAACLVAA